MDCDVFRLHRMSWEVTLGRGHELLIYWNPLDIKRRFCHYSSLPFVTILVWSNRPAALSPRIIPYITLTAISPSKYIKPAIIPRTTESKGIYFSCTHDSCLTNWTRPIMTATTTTSVISIIRFHLL